jgi:hypothetical protein
MNREMTEPDLPSNVKVNRCGLLLAAAVLAYIAAVVGFIIFY